MAYTKQFHLHGINYPSKKDPAWTRQEFLEGISKRWSTLQLERFEYNGEPALMVIREDSMDIGVVPEDVVPKLIKRIDKPYRLNILDIYFFDEDSDRRGVKIEFEALPQEWIDAIWDEKARQAEVGRLLRERKEEKRRKRKEAFGKIFHRR